MYIFGFRCIKMQAALSEIDKDFDVSTFDPEQAEVLRYLSGLALDQVPLPELGIMVMEEIFGKEIDRSNQNLFLAYILDETQPLQGELAARLGGIYESNGFRAPDIFSMQVMGRRAGLSGKIPDELGIYCSVMCLRDYQIIKFDDQTHFIGLEKISPVFDLSNYKPYVPRNSTRVNLGNGKATIKRNDYLCLLVWAFWDSNPTYGSTVMDTEALGRKIAAMASEQKEGDFEEKVQTQVNEPGIVL